MNDDVSLIQCEGLARHGNFDYIIMNDKQNYHIDSKYEQNRVLAQEFMRSYNHSFELMIESDHRTHIALLESLECSQSVSTNLYLFGEQYILNQTKYIHPGIDKQFFVSNQSDQYKRYDQGLCYK
jgi:hypothetical protein